MMTCRSCGTPGRALCCRCTGKLGGRPARKRPVLSVVEPFDLAADRREEWIALSELVSLRKVS